MIGSYQIYPDQKLVVYKIVGVPVWAEILELWIQMTADPRYKNHYRGIGDWQSAERGMERSDVQAMSEFIKTNNATTAFWVVIVNDPYITAFGMIYKGLTSEQHSLEICCTRERASELLNFDVEPYLI